MVADPKPRFFRTEAAFRKWLEANHGRKDELWVGFYKKASGKGGLTYKQAVDQALCFGWIDGLAKTIDDNAYRQRFTPRRKTSTWSAINIKRVGELKKLGLMHPAGLKAFQERDPRKTSQYSFENAPEFSAAQKKTFKANRKAWEFFQAQPPGYRRTATWWVVSAKKEETRDRRLSTLIEDSAAGRRIAQLA
ncbi:MAG TPA: YdeI/OmpD-associated family protein [Actinomycetota bacterium]|nr:YdeI/OmpD-associated family protein [Actinomycetota bacterium]